jgi:hypothetical protein
MQQNVQTLPTSPGQAVTSKGMADMFMFATGIERDSYAARSANRVGHASERALQRHVVIAAHLRGAFANPMNVIPVKTCVYRDISIIGAGGGTRTHFTRLGECRENTDCLGKTGPQCV